MSSFLFALVAVFATSLGGRDQLLVARLSAKLGTANGLLATACATATLAAIGMAWAAQIIGDVIPVSGKQMLVAFALFFAGVELLWPNREKAPTEPTRSLGAIGIVLLARQLGDAARFCVFAFAAATGTPHSAAAGGALGGIAAMVLAWGLAADLDRLAWLRPLRMALGAVILIIAIVIGLTARGLL